VCDSNSIDLSPGTLHIYYDAPIPTKDLSAEDVGALKELVRQKMLSRLLAAQN
jgi:hypothetical protein